MELKTVKSRATYKFQLLLAARVLTDWTTGVPLAKDKQML
jgi:hypothetical protein